MDDPVTEPSALDKAKQKIQDHRTLQDETRQIAGSGGELWTPDQEAEGCPLTPASDHIIIRKEEAVGKVGMIHLPGKAAEKTRPNRGTVLRVGDEVSLFKEGDWRDSSVKAIPAVIEMGKRPYLHEGDVVIYHEYGEVKFTYMGVDYVAIRQKDVICRVEKTDAQKEEAGLPEGSTSGESS